jgi:outer membrane protein OmpA-like peptidoglycan-associated protein
MRRELPYLLKLLPVALFAAHVGAEEVNFGKSIPSADNILEYLKAPADNEEFTISKDGIKTRGLIFVEQKDKRPLKSKPITPVQNQKALSLEILFAYNSAVLTENGQQQLRPVGEALANAELKGKHYIVEGHTDIIGSDGFNFDLSRRRAESVKEFLLSQFSLPASALKIEGKGKQNLANPEDPTSEVNRRVRIVMMPE